MNFNKKTINDFKMRLEDSLGKLNPSQLDQVKVKGNQAEQLLNNPDFDTFINWYRFNLFTDLSNIREYDDLGNNKRIAIAHNLSGIDGFIEYLSKLVKRKDEVMNFQTKKETVINTIGNPFTDPN